MNSIGYFEIQSDDLAASRAFYGALFGWSFQRNDALPIEYWEITTPTITGGLLPRPAALPPSPSGTNAYVCSVQVADFDDMSARILSAGGRVALAKLAVPGRCWQGYFLDPDGNTFGIFEPDPSAA